MEIRARLAVGRSLAPEDFADLTATAVESVTFGEDGRLVVTFAADLTADEQTKVTDRIKARNAIEESLRAQARTALDKDRTFATTTAPQLLSGADSIITNTTSSQQEIDLAKAVKALTNQTAALSQQNVKLIRMALGLLDGTE